MSEDKSGPAFPNHPTSNGWEGLSKREWFAGMVVQGLLSNKDYIRHVGKKYANENVTLIMAEQCLEMADALMKELDK